MTDLATRIARHERIPLAHLPTPLEALPRLSEQLGRPVYVKRDDCTGLGGGGNKLRKLEFLMAEARADGADTVITVGAPQSNHARQTAAVAARLGLHCELLLEPSSQCEPAASYLKSGNLLLDRLFGARLHFLETDADRAGRMQTLAEDLRGRGRRPYLIDVGGSSPRGTLGYVAAAIEVVEQARKRDIALDTIVLATGSCGTHAGLLLGFRALGLDTGVQGIATAPEPGQPRRRRRIRELIDDTSALLGLNSDIGDEEIRLNDDYSGPGYGVLTREINATLHRVAQAEGLMLDPVYTGKAMDAMLNLSERGDLGRGTLVFWHTGGWPALFGYTELLDPSASNGPDESSR